MNQTLKTELKLFLAEALLQLIGYKQEALVFGLLSLDTRQRNIIRERRRMTSTLWKQVIRRYPYCLACKSEKNLEVDHITPLFMFGKSEWGNLQTLCRSCNARKGIKIKDYRI